MSKNNTKSSVKTQRREAALKKAKRKKVLIAGLCAAAVVAVLAFAIHAIVREHNTETYSGNGQMVQFLADGSYSATLAHNVRRSGTYTKTSEDSGITVEFNTNGMIEIGSIVNNTLLIPEGWDDYHNHGRILYKR
jgi:hypothetical protein